MPTMQSAHLEAARVEVRRSAGSTRNPAVHSDTNVRSEGTSAEVFATVGAFVDAANGLAELARFWGISAPAFRSPPADPRVARSIRRSRSGSVVAIRVQGRLWTAVAADMVDGLFAVHPGCDTAARRYQAAARIAGCGGGGVGAERGRAPVGESGRSRRAGTGPVRPFGAAA